MSDLADDPDFGAFAIRDEPRIGASRASLRKARSGEWTAIWGVVILLGVTVAAYAIRMAGQPAPVAPAPAPVAKVAPAPAPRPRPVVRRTAPAKDAAPVATAVSNVPSAADAPRRAVDPVEGFDSGEAFDNPTSPGRYGQRSSGVLERTPSPPRPNRPDPSFGPR